MKQLPESVTPYKRTAEFTETTVPTAILNEHRTKAGVWGKIVVLEGRLEYVILEPETESVELSQDKYGVVEPEILHHVKPIGNVRFYVEFCR